ncbi:MAG: SigE family RNA polymerase sigma factor [Dactylosporangium sp.]|nr:SigE family RNA polymerase sigma factor [Dactylosporangium sp.]NNJ60931.1 SigE family RNA polymerase sigma factor [Dactylosporangium sp.]
MATATPEVGVPTGVKVDASFDAFVGARSTGLLRTAYLLTGDHGHAEDLLQTALLRAARHWRRAREAPEAYVRKILVNLSRDRIRLLRRRPREAPLPDGLDRHATGTGADEHLAEQHRMARALARLPARQRQVVVLRFFNDLSVAHTAELIGCSEGTVKSYTARALTQLRLILAETTPATADGTGQAATNPSFTAQRLRGRKPAHVNR